MRSFIRFTLFLACWSSLSLQGKYLPQTYPGPILDGNFTEETYNTPQFAVQTAQIPRKVMSGFEFKQYFNGDAFLKVLNQNECHRGFQYHEGLCQLEKFKIRFSLTNPITLGERFRAKGSCTGGGLYLTKLSALGNYMYPYYGNHLRVIYIPDSAKVWPDPVLHKFKVDKLVVREKLLFTDRFEIIQSTHLDSNYLWEKDHLNISFSDLIKESTKLLGPSQAPDLDREKLLAKGLAASQMVYSSGEKSSSRLARYVIGMLFLEQTILKVKGSKPMLATLLATEQIDSNDPWGSIWSQLPGDKDFHEFRKQLRPLSSCGWWVSLSDSIKKDHFNPRTWKTLDFANLTGLTQTKKHKDDIEDLEPWVNYLFFNWQMVATMIQSHPDFYFDVTKKIEDQLEKNLMDTEMEYTLNHLVPPSSGFPLVQNFIDGFLSYRR